MVKITYNENDVVIDNKIVSKKEIIHQYIELNLQKKQLSEMFAVSLSTIEKILAHFHITKSTSLIEQNRKRNLLAKYGVENISQLQDVKEKKVNTTLNKYGVENVSQSREIQEKKEQTFAKHYGTKYYFQTEEFKQSFQENCIKKYGTTNYAKTTECKNKITTTNKKKYGVAWTCMRKEARKYGSSNSAPNKAFEKLLKKNHIEYTREFPLESYSYDFKVGYYLIEVNPSVSHNIDWSPFTSDHTPTINADYHLNKTSVANKNGYRCIHIWDWDNVQSIVNLLVQREKIYARQCTIAEVDNKTCAEFLKWYHVQGYAKSSIRIGLFYQNELVSVAAFGKPRYNKKYDYELIRYCSKCNIVGGAQKIFSHFCEKYNFLSVISYCDLSKFTGETYLKLGFKLLRISKPTVHWYNTKNKTHYTDNLIREHGFSRIVLKEEPGKTFLNTNNNTELMRQYNYIRVYDCGQATYVYHKNK